MLALWLKVAVASQLAATAVSSVQSGSQSAVWRPNKYVEQFRAECPGCNPLIAAGEPLCDVCASRFAVTALSSFGSGSLQESRSQRSANSHDPYAIAAEIPESPLNPNSAEFHPSPQSQATGGVQHLHNANEHHFAHYSQFAQRPQRRGQLHRGNVPRDLVPNWVLQMPTKWPSVEELHRYESPPPSYGSVPKAVRSPPSDLLPWQNASPTQIPTRRIPQTFARSIWPKARTLLIEGTVDERRIVAVMDSISKAADESDTEQLTDAILRLLQGCVPQSESYNHGKLFLDFATDNAALVFSQLYTAMFSSDSFALLRPTKRSPDKSAVDGWKHANKWTLDSDVIVNALANGRDSVLTLFTDNDAMNWPFVERMLRAAVATAPLPSDAKQFDLQTDGRSMQCACASKSLAVWLAAVMAELRADTHCTVIELAVSFQ